MSGKGAKLAQTTCQAMDMMELHVNTWVPQSVNTVPNKIVVYLNFEVLMFKSQTECSQCP